MSIFKTLLKYVKSLNQDAREYNIYYKQLQEEYNKSKKKGK